LDNLSVSANTAPAALQPVQSSVPPARASESGGSRWLFPAALGCAWALLILHLWLEWSTNEQYGYGKVVPLLALYLAWNRWTDRPDPGRPRAFRPIAWLLPVLVTLLIPLRLILETSPEWRTISWLVGGIAAVISLALIYGAGGAPWVRHFSVPVLFMLVAIPWPHRLETHIMQALMQAVAVACTEALHWGGWPATRLGNVIDIGTAVVGVEEACSGVRSLQTTLMSSLFLGELFRFGLGRRATLLVAGLIFAFFCNLGRSLLLVWVSATRGAPAVDEWHDPVGLVVLAVTIAGLFGLAALLRRSDDALPDAAPGSNAFIAPGRQLPAALLIAIIGIVATAEAGTRLWFYTHDQGDVPTTRVELRLPKERTGFTKLPLPETTFDLLRHDYGQIATWLEPGGVRITSILLTWNRGNPTRYLAEQHTPDICLPSAGAVLEETLGPKLIPFAGVEIAFQRYRFSGRDGPTHVFYSRIEEGVPPAAGKFLDGKRSRGGLQEAFAGRRRLGQQVFEVAVTGAHSAEAAEQTMRTALANLVIWHGPRP
jgi:exosortase